MSRPLVGNADAACEPDLAVHDQQTAMRSVVVLHPVEPSYAAEPGDLAAGVAHLIDELVGHRLSSFAVENESHHHATPGGIGKRRRELSRHRPRPIDVRGEVDGRLALADRGEHRRKDLVAVLEHLDLVALDHALSSGCILYT